jgi:hypothetical protein
LSHPRFFTNVFFGDASISCATIAVTPSLSPRSITVGGHRIFSPKYAVHYVIGTGVLAAFFLLEFVASAFGHSHVVCYRASCETLIGSGAQFLNWWYAAALVMVLVMFVRNLYLWRLALRSTSA